MAMKLIALFFLIPVSVIVYRMIWSETEVIPINGDDFKYLIGSNIKVFRILTSDGRVIDVLLLIWFIGFVMFYVVSMFRSITFINKLVGRSALVKDKEIMDIVEELKNELKISRNVEIYQSVEIISPFLTGVFRPKIIIPKVASTLNTKEKMRLALHHELIHLKSHDVPFKILLNFVQKFHWFNPVLYIFVYRFCNMSEFVCDQKVIEGMEKSKRRIYAELLLSISKEKTKSGKLVSALRGDGYKFMERRVYQIMRYKKQKISMKFILAMVLLGLCTPAVTYASSKAALNVEDKIVKLYENSFKMVEDTSSDQLVEYTKEIGDLQKMESFKLPQTRGSNMINITLLPGVSTTSDKLYLKKGQQIVMNCTADNASDTFEAGYLFKNIVYVNSKNGMVSHTFTVPSDGTYYLYFCNTGSKNIHVTGSAVTR